MGFVKKKKKSLSTALMLRSGLQSVSHPIYVNSLLIFAVGRAFCLRVDLSEHLWQAGWSEALIRAMASCDGAGEARRVSAPSRTPRHATALISSPPRAQGANQANERLWCRGCTLRGARWRVIGAQRMRRRRGSGGRRGEAHLLLMKPPLHTARCWLSGGCLRSLKHCAACQSPGRHRRTFVRCVLIDSGFTRELLVLTQQMFHLFFTQSFFTITFKLCFL